ncbi:MAG: YbfB/YjiJ family MFS transporter [Rhodospirillales bacterium]|nr:YbfB/YjiJ family MFS transporter [Rhodospirillales bacterium]MBO6785880.1 YbfB/YjiJ family MFS transporter [Rhodospirillales bacterium]
MNKETSSAPPRPWIPYALAGLCASLIGIGLGRFAYTPLLPALIEASWFTETDAVYLGAANLAGYLAGALGGKSMAARLPAHQVIRIMMLLCAVSFIACAEPVSFLWYFVWRFAAGYTGGALMVLGASTVLPHVPAGKRGVAGGVIFTGVGLGIALSGTLVPALIGVGLVETWTSIGVLSLALSLASWRFWPPAEPRSDTAQPKPASAFRLPFTSLYAVYGLVAAGLVAHMVFLVDYVARGLGQGITVGGFYWFVFGAGAAIGPIAAGKLADRMGFRRTIRLGLMLQTAGVALAFISAAPLALGISSFVVGAVVPGIVPLVAGRAHELSGSDTVLQRTAWSYATVAFSVGQAGAAYAFSYAFELTGRYDLLFQAGAAAVALAFVIDFLTPERQLTSKENEA